MSPAEGERGAGQQGRGGVMVSAGGEESGAPARSGGAGAGILVECM